MTNNCNFCGDYLLSEETHYSCEERPTLRDQLAMAALTGLLTSPAILGQLPHQSASDAYEMADAMMKQRSVDND